MTHKLCQTGAKDGEAVTKEMGRLVCMADQNFLYFPNRPPRIANKQQMIKFDGDNSQASN